MSEKRIPDQNQSKTFDRYECSRLNYEIEEYKMQCSSKQHTESHKIISNKDTLESSTVSTFKKNFKTQIVVNENIYEIQIRSTNNLKSFNNSIRDFVDKNVQAIHNKTGSINGFTDGSSNANDHLVHKTPHISTGSKRSSTSVMNIKNNIENWPEQLEPSSTVTVNKKTILNDRRHVKIPHGVVPFENNLNILQADEDETMKMRLLDANRFSVAISETDADNNFQKNDIAPLEGMQNADADSVSGTREENGSNVVDQNNSHFKKALKHENKDIINSAFEDLNLYGPEKTLKTYGGNSIDTPNEEDIHVIHRSDVDDRNNRFLMNGKKLKNEVSEDQGKAYPDETHFQVEDEDGNYVITTILYPKLNQSANELKIIHRE